MGILESGGTGFFWGDNPEFSSYGSNNYYISNIVFLSLGPTLEHLLSSFKNYHLGETPLDYDRGLVIESFESSVFFGNSKLVSFGSQGPC